MRSVATTQTATARHSNPTDAQTTSQSKASITAVHSRQSTVDGQGPEASHGGLWLATSHSVPESRILTLDPDLIHHHQAKDQRQVNDGSEEQAPCRGVRPREGQADSVMKETRTKYQRPDEVDQPHMTQERG